MLIKLMALNELAPRDASSTIHNQLQDYQVIISKLTIRELRKATIHDLRM